MSNQKQKFTEKDIVINEMFSRSGKATENLYLSLAKVKELQKQEPLSKNQNFLRERISATVQEIEQHFELIKNRREEEKQALKQKIKQEAEQKLAINSRLRYNEKLYTNRKNHSANFKAITRRKRDNMADGKGIKFDQVPCVGHYDPKFEIVESDTYLAKDPIKVTETTAQVSEAPVRSRRHQKTRLYKIEDMDLEPSLFVPFQNAKLEDHKYLIVKSLSKVRSRIQEGVHIEVMIDPTEVKKQRPWSSAPFNKQISKRRHPNTKQSTKALFTEQCTQYAQFQMKHRYSEAAMRVHSNVTPSNIYINLNSASSAHIGIIPDNTSPIAECEIGDYDPQFKISTPKMASGLISLSKQTSRVYLPTGRPTEAPNLVFTRVASGSTVDEMKAANAYYSLGHVIQNSSTNFSQTKSRDLGFYMSNDRVKNILFDNEKISKIQTKRLQSAGASRTKCLNFTSTNYQSAKPLS